MNIYKRVNQLTNSDFEQYPVWKFLTDIEDQYDESYTKPYSQTTDIDPKTGIYVIRTRFETNDGTVYYGYCYANKKKDLSYIQPVIILGTKQICFWFGMYKPVENDKEKICKKFKKEYFKLFPIKYVALEKVNGSPYAGTINGLLYLDKNDRVTSIS